MIDDLNGATDEIAIAMLELAARKLPLMIRRYLPEGFYEDWGVDELIWNSSAGGM